MFENKECSNGTKQGCYLEPGTRVNEEDQNEWLEETVWYGMRMWHVIFLAIGAVLSFIILLCCCFKFRIPRTKQEIEGDYIRRKIMRKFRKRLKAIQNQELDEMDLKKALDKIRTELKSDTESLQQSDVLSGATLSSTGGNPAAGSTYRRASQIQIDISLEDLRIQSMGLGARIALAFTRFFGKTPKKTPGAESDEENGGNGLEDTGIDKPTTALIPSKKQTEDDTSKKKKGKEGKAGDAKVEGASTSTGNETKTGAKVENKATKDKKKDSTNTPSPLPAPTTPAPTTILATEKETGSGDKKQDKKSNKGKKEKQQKKGKTEAESSTNTTTPAAPTSTSGTGAASNNKSTTEKVQKIGSTTDKKSNEQPK